VEVADGVRLNKVRLFGGGFVITSADDRVDPVIAFSPSGANIVQDASNPFWALISGDIAARAAAVGGCSTSTGKRAVRVASATDGADGAAARA
jgi:hypothetical protein